MKHKTALALCLTIVFLFVAATIVCATEPLKFYRGQAGDQTFALRQGYVNNYELEVSTNKAVTVPTGYAYAIFAANADIWVKVGGTAAVPSGDVTDGTGSELNPTIRVVEPGGTIGVISESAAKVSITFYK